MDEPIVRLLPSGYWHARWNQNRWIQWPNGRAPTLEDGFGWITPAMQEQAVRSALAPREEAGDAG